MKKIKLLSLLKKISSTELELFHKYLKQHHYREKIALQVFEYLIRFYPDFDRGEKLELEFAYQKIFKSNIDQTGNVRKKMLNAASDLYKWLKAFLINEKVKQSPVICQSIWLGILQERGLKEEFSRKAAAFYQQTRCIPFKSPDDALPNWLASYYQRKQLAAGKFLMHAEDIRQCSFEMQEYWEVIRLKMAYQTALLDSASNQTKKSWTVDSLPLGIQTLIALYQALWELIKIGDEKYFAVLESLLTDFGQHIDPIELNEIIRNAYIFIAEQSRHSMEFIHFERMHRLNKIWLLHVVHTKGSLLPSSAFGNFVITACYAKDFVWATAFIEHYSHIVPETDRQKAVQIAQAIVAFECGNFQEVIQLLEGITFGSLFDMLRAKSLLLRSHYELGSDIDTMLNICEPLEHVLRRIKKIEASIATLAFVLILKKLVNKTQSKQAIFESIQKAKSLYSKSWLLDKLEKYEPIYAKHKRR